MYIPSALGKRTLEDDGVKRKERNHTADQLRSNLRSPLIYCKSKTRGVMRCWYGKQELPGPHYKAGAL